MPGLVKFPHVVQEAKEYFADLFCCEPQRQHFAEYLTGLMVAERKTVRGMNQEFADTTDQSCLNRFLTEADWDVAALNRRRLETHQEDPSTRYSDHGVIPIDNVLIDHDGKLIMDVGYSGTTPNTGTKSLMIICSLIMSAPAASIIRWTFAASANANCAKLPGSPS